MNFLKSLFKNELSDKPEDYSKIYFRWEKEGQEYGPLWFDDMITRKWSKPPLEGRFENDSKWKPYSYFQKILTSLKISKEQSSLMEKSGVSNIDLGLSFVDAVKIIQRKNEELKEQRAKEREEKDQLPATKQTLKKLTDLGITFDKTVTRREAKELMEYYKNREYLVEIFDYLRKLNFNFVEQLSIDSIVKGIDDNLPTFDQFDDLYTSLQSLENFGLQFNFPNTINKDELEKLIIRINDAEFEAEDIETQFKEREIILGDSEFKIVGKLPKNQLKKIRAHIFNKSLSGNWDIDKDLRNVIKTFLPDVVLKEIEY